MSSLPPYEPSSWKLSVHGDSRQRKWAEEVCRLCPDYEPFWQRHIVPLTFRPHDKANYFVRPKQKKHLLRVADTSYAIFLHFTGMLRWSGLLLDYERPGAAPQRERPGVAPQSKRPEAAPQSKRPGAAPQSKRPGVAPQRERPEAAPQPKRPDVAPQREHPEATPQPKRPDVAPQREHPSPAGGHQLSVHAGRREGPAVTGAFDPGLEFRPTDCLYYFFSHAYSLLESSGSFADAVNQTLEKYHEPTAFFVSRETKMSPWRFDRRGSSMVSKRWHELASLSKVYRNALVHERPLLVQSGYLPAPDAKAIAELSGLVAISRMALHERSILECCVETPQVVDPIVATAAKLVNRLWGSATERLDAIGTPKYREHQLTLRPEEACLSLDKIRAARES